MSELKSEYTKNCSEVKGSLSNDSMQQWNVRRKAKLQVS